MQEVEIDGEVYIVTSIGMQNFASILREGGEIDSSLTFKFTKVQEDD